MGGDYLSGEAAESFEDDEGLSPEPTDTDSPAYPPRSAWTVEEALPSGYLVVERLGYYKGHRLVTCLRSRDLDPDTNRDRPRLRCLDCGREADDPTALAPFHSPCSHP